MKLKDIILNEEENFLDGYSEDEIVSMNNEWNDENDKDFFVCYASEFNDYKDLLDDVDPKKAKAKLKDFFWIDRYGGFHTATREATMKKMIANISTPKAKKYLGF